MKNFISNLKDNLTLVFCNHDWKGYCCDNQGRWQDGRAFTGCMKCKTSKSYEKTEREKKADEYNKHRFAYTQDINR